MRIKKDKKFSVLSRPSFDDSYIIRIKKKDVYRKVKNKADRKPRIAGTIPRKSNIVKYKEEYYQYMFYFIVDLRKAIDIDRKLSVRFSVRSNLKTTKYSMFSSLDDKSSKGLIASLYGKNKDIRSEIATADKENLIFRKYMNPIRGINPRKLKKAKKLNDRQLFGTIELTDLIDGKKLSRIGKNVQLAQKTINLNNDEMINSRTFQGNYEKSFLFGTDPASLLFGTHDETPADPRKSGTFSRPNLKSGRRIKDSTMFSMRSQATGDTDDSGEISTSESNGESEVAVNVRRINRRRLLSTKVMLKRSEIGNSKFFFVVLDLMDDKGLIYQTLNIRINHRENVQDYYAPRSNIESQIESTRLSPKNSAKISLKRRDTRIREVEVYIREISEINPLAKSSFSKKKRIRFKRSQMSYSQNQFFLVPRDTSKMTIMRVVPVSRTGEVYGGFSSSSIMNASFIPTIAGIYTTVKDGYINVELTNASDNVIGACFEKRDVTLNQKRYKKVVRPSVNDQTQQAALVNQPGTMIRSRGKGSLGSYVIQDRDVKEGHLYEYRVRLYLDCGVTRMSTISRFQKYTTPLDAVKMSINNITVTTPKNPPKISEFSRGTAINVSLDISYSTSSDTSTQLKDALSAAGLDDLYTDEMEDLKTTLDNLIFFEIERFNNSTGETFYLGSFSAADTILDDGIATTAPAPITGQRYTYRVSAAFVSPEDIVTFEKQKATYGTTSFSSTKDIRNPSRISTIKVAALSAAVADTSPSALASTFLESKARKSFSKSSFSKGLVKSDEAVVATIESVMSEFLTGDSFEFNVNTGSRNMRAKDRRVSVGARSGPIVKWRPILRGGPVDHLVDFFIVIAKKSGRKYVAGTCINPKSDMCRFVDHHNKNFIGRIRYSVKPVFLDGNIGKEMRIGNVLMVNRNDKFKRGV